MKVRVICSDPFATDSSSDEDQDQDRRFAVRKKLQNKKVFIKELLIPISTNQGSLSREDGAILCGNLEAMKSPGITVTNLDECQAQFSSSMDREKTLLGCDSTVKKASNDNNKNKVEYQCLKEKMMHINSNKEGKEALKTKTSILKDVSVYRVKAGKGAEVVESVLENHLRDKAKFGLRSPNSLLDCPENESRADLVARSAPDPGLKRKYMGIRQRNSGRWTAEIHLGGHKCHLGNFKTAEEASNAYNRARVEFDSKKIRQQLGHEGSNVNLNKGKVKFIKPHFQRVVGHDSGINESRVGVNNVYSENSQCRRGHSLFDFEQEVDCHSKVANEALTITSESGSSRVTIDSRQESKGGQRNVENWERHGLCPTTGNEEESGAAGIIDQYGRLIGEYSRLDDELWICGLEDDVDNLYGYYPMECS